MLTLHGLFVFHLCPSLYFEYPCLRYLWYPYNHPAKVAHNVHWFLFVFLKLYFRHLTRLCPIEDSSFGPSHTGHFSSSPPPTPPTTILLHARAWPGFGSYWLFCHLAGINKSLVRLLSQTVATAASDFIRPVRVSVSRLGTNMSVCLGETKAPVWIFCCSDLGCMDRGTGSPPRGPVGCQGLC